MIECPVCGSQVDVYEQYEPEDAHTTTLVDHDHGGTVECQRVCNRVTHSYWQACCDNCDELLDVLDEYIQPCNANGYPTLLLAFKPDVLTAQVVDAWLKGLTDINGITLLYRKTRRGSYERH
jgi:hypothetical protein